MNHCNFLRALGILGIYQHAVTNPMVNVERLGIPKSV
ncbi:AraC family transcriptional regulator, partial [Vibrio cyclitrophicus]